MENSEYFKIGNVSTLPPFFMNIVSGSDLWTFASSNGGITAGRRSAEFALFPYYTDDKITDLAETTGSKTIIRKGGVCWEPFSVRSEACFRLERNLYKSRVGNSIIFEETNLDWGLRFSWSWTGSDRFGFVREAKLENLSDDAVGVEIIDGLQNLMPCGVPSGLQQGSSNLVNAYKKTELDPETGLAMVCLSAIIIDRAEPSEALKCNVVWQSGLKDPVHLLSTEQLAQFRGCAGVREETVVKGEPGAYLLGSLIRLEAGESKRWMIVADVAKDATAVVELKDFLLSSPDAAEEVRKDVDASTARLVELVASADGVQTTADAARTARHFSNTMFNIMRGGVPMAEATAQNPLPLGFGRRHGDPTRPWNVFNINTKDPLTGKPILDYEGNWRDIFQNWEALAISWPKLTGAMIAKFLDCSTADGYNPYRVTRSGFDWETVDPKNPWSYIGYWGDHQVIYLERLLEAQEAHFPGSLAGMLACENFVYANVPYRIKPYSEILKNPKSTIEFDFGLSASLKAGMACEGVEAAYVKGRNGRTVKASMMEKLLVSILAKLANFVPGGGIWMNTQRPEWNDANNALVGGGLSVVTLCYLRRELAFLRGIVKDSAPVAEEVLVWMWATVKALKLSDTQAVMNALGESSSAYRKGIYEKSFSGRKAELSSEEAVEFFDTALAAVEASIRANRRADGLWHSYNLLELSEGRFAGIRHLQEMLEGQVAVLSCGVLSSAEALQLLDALRHSALWREDQRSYMLYPNRELPGFLQKNNLPADALKRSAALAEMVARGERGIVSQDRDGGLHWNGDFRNADGLKAALDKAGISGEEAGVVLDLFEETFDHKAFTGRSGTFFAYEGLGSIYWHMVSKLLVAVQECYFAALDAGAPETSALAAHYHEILEGTGIHKSAREYGAFPTDAYSHTPWGKGARQPGMTGQVKEDIIARFGELGVRVREGRVSIEPTLLSDSEFLPDGTLKFSYCGAQVTLHKGGRLELSEEESQDLFARRLQEINVTA